MFGLFKRNPIENLQPPVEVVTEPMPDDITVLQGGVAFLRQRTEQQNKILETLIPQFRMLEAECHSLRQTLNAMEADRLLRAGAIRILEATDAPIDVVVEPEESAQGINLEELRSLPRLETRYGMVSASEYLISGGMLNPGRRVTGEFTRAARNYVVATYSKRPALRPVCPNAASTVMVYSVLDLNKVLDDDLLERLYRIHKNEGGDFTAAARAYLTKRFPD